MHSFPNMAATYMQFLFPSFLGVVFLMIYTISSFQKRQYVMQGG